MLEASEPMSHKQTIRSIAVHREDVIRAHEVTLRTDRQVVMRITPPLEGRKRARIHETTAVSESYPTTGTDSDEPMHINPAALLGDSPAYPEPDDTAPGGTDDVESHHQRHQKAVAEWRAEMKECITDETQLKDHGTVSVNGL